MLNVKLRDRFEIVCRDKDGNEKWREVLMRDREPPTPSLGALGLVTVLLLALLIHPVAFIALPALCMLGLITNVGLDHILDSQFTGSAQVDPWFIGLISSAGFTGIVAADTMASHAGWVELTTYSEGVRQTWDEAAASGQIIASSSVATFTQTAGATIKGAFLTSSDTKGGATGTLFSAALFDEGDRVVANTDTLDVTYSLSASDN